MILKKNFSKCENKKFIYLFFFNFFNLFFMYLINQVRCPRIP